MFSVACGLRRISGYRPLSLWLEKMAYFCMTYLPKICGFIAKSPPRFSQLHYFFLPNSRITDTHFSTVHCWKVAAVVGNDLKMKLKHSVEKFIFKYVHIRLVVGTFIIYAYHMLQLYHHNLTIILNNRLKINNLLKPQVHLLFC